MCRPGVGLLGRALGLSQEACALDVCRAPSGTLLGLLLDPSRADVDSVGAWVRRRVDVGVAAYPLVDGGPRPDGTGTQETEEGP
jgi:hypothetical protein